MRLMAGSMAGQSPDARDWDAIRAWASRLSGSPTG
jgi:hypothetical protein